MCRPVAAPPSVALSLVSPVKRRCLACLTSLIAMESSKPAASNSNAGHAQLRRAWGYPRAHLALFSRRGQECALCEATQAARACVGHTTQHDGFVGPLPYTPRCMGTPACRRALWVIVGCARVEIVRLPECRPISGRRWPHTVSPCAALFVAAAIRGPGSQQPSVLGRRQAA
jgi:hypothetical protein